MNDTARLFEIFLDIQRGLPRQGPGCAEATHEALVLCGALPEELSVLDVGCGPGLQTMTLADVLGDALGRPIAALDMYGDYLRQLKASCAARGLDRLVAPLQGDMEALPFAEESFDLIWAEGAAYIMGFAEAFAAWRPLLRSGGCIAATELTWLVAKPPEEAARFFAEEYPAMTDVETNLASLQAAGFEVLGHFTLPDAAWWTDYYTPLEAKLPALRARYAEDAMARDFVATSAREIEMRRRHPDSYGYVFFVGRKTG